MHRILMLLAAVALLALTASGCGDGASTTSAPDEDLTPPAAPINVSASLRDVDVTVAWTRNSEVDFASYRVYRSVNSGEFTVLADCNQARFVDSIEDFGLYEMSYRVTAIDANDNESALSDNVEVIVDNPEPMIASEQDW